MYRIRREELNTSAYHEQLYGTTSVIRNFRASTETFYQWLIPADRNKGSWYYLIGQAAICILHAGKPSIVMLVRDPRNLAELRGNDTLEKYPHI